ncbi:MAG: DNA polymerase Y family protein [Thermoanaerobaculia bacterium]|nr:DNA polymerase Y family protein [Thermoanaerobaculia bacterium]
MTRIACLSVPLFPLAARLRSEPDLEPEAVAVVEGSGNAARVVAATRRARRGGVRRGMSLPQARALLPKLIVRARDAECERAARESLLEIVESFSPRVEDAGQGVVFLDLTGLERHYRAADEAAEPAEPPPTDERAPHPGGARTGAGRRTAASPTPTGGPSDGGDATELRLGRALQAASEKAGLPARVGIASSKLAARVAAESSATPVVVAAGSEASFLAPLPLARLAPEAAVVETLHRWGVRSIGELARLPKNRVASRLGAEGRMLLERARGVDRRPIIPYRPPPAFHEGTDLDWPLVAIEPFLFVARAALDRLCRRLEGRGLACSRLELALRLEPHGHDERSIALPSPTREVKTLLTLIRLDLERRPPGAAVTGFTLTAHPDRPREAQLTLFGSASLSPDRLATTLARLFALLGPDGAGSPRTVDGHLPERCALVDYRPPPPPRERPETRPRHGLLAVRVLRPPVPLEVLTDGVSGPAAGNPVEVRPAVAAAEEKRPVIGGRIRVASGPWTVEEGWWTEEAVAREYWDVELGDGGVYRIYRERVSGDWFADGLYD